MVGYGPLATVQVLGEGVDPAVEEREAVGWVGARTDAVVELVREQHVAVRIRRGIPGHGGDGRVLLRRRQQRAVARLSNTYFSSG